MTSPRQIDIIGSATRNTKFRHVIYVNPQVEVTIQSLTPGRVIAWEQHTQTQIFQGVVGSTTIDVGSERMLLFPGQIIIVPPHTQHQVSNQNFAVSKFITFYAPADHEEGLVED